MWSHNWRPNEGNEKERRTEILLPSEDQVRLHGLGVDHKKEQGTSNTMDDDNYYYEEPQQDYINTIDEHSVNEDDGVGTYMNTDGVLPDTEEPASNEYDSADRVSSYEANGQKSISDADVVVEDKSNGSILMTDLNSPSLYASRDVLITAEEDPNQSLFFANSSSPQRIDYVLTYNAEEVNHRLEKLRNTFEENLVAVGVLTEREFSSDGKTGCLKIHSPWDALAKGAKLLRLRKKIKVCKEMDSNLCNCGCFKVFSPKPNILPDEEDFFTAEFDPSKLENFAIDNRDDFFTNAERSLITKMFIDSTECPEKDDEGRQYIHKGIDTMLHHKVYTAAFPLHESRIIKDTGDPDFYNGEDKDRLRLYHGWAKPSNIFRFQPLDYVRKYFGEKIGMYFAWLGTYTLLLIPAAIFGFAVFLYGLITLREDEPSLDVCDDNRTGNYTICPLCDNQCDFQKLSGSCLYARLTYVFDNYATVALAIFMSAWALVFLEIWKREQAGFQFMWDIGDYEAEERYRPSYSKNAKHFKVNPITEKAEPYLPWYQKLWRLSTSLSIIAFFVGVVVVAIFSVLVYRLAVAAALFAVGSDGARHQAKLITSVTASIINLLIITVLGIVYNRLAMFATKLEKHKTFTDHEDSYTFKIIVFQFINYYGSIIYIAYFKGSFVDPPGKTSMYVFGRYRQDQCDPTGCFIELTIQLAIIMVGKQAINGVVELLVPSIKNCIRRIKDEMKNRKRWEDDLDLEAYPQFIFFDEYLEMTIQFGFVVLFVTAFPLAPVFALLNNIIEIRLDAYKAIKLFRRPPALKTEDIGAWYSILRWFAYIGVITNAFIIAWTSEFIPKVVYEWNSGRTKLQGYMNASLSVTNSSILIAINNDSHALIYDTNGQPKSDECRFRGYFETDSEMNYIPKREYWQIFFARMAFVIVFEHCCLLIMSLISVLVPDVSARVRRMRRYERQLVRRMAFEDAFTDVREKRRIMYIEAAKFHLDRLPH